jgi:hypothetical protein
MLPTPNYATSMSAYPQPMPQAVASSSSSSSSSYMSGQSCLIDSSANTAFTGCFGNLTPPKTDCFSKMKRHKPHHGERHHMGRHHGNMSGGYCKTSESSVFASQQPMGGLNQCYPTTNGGAGGVPAFVTDMMKDFKQAFGDMGGAFDSGQNYAQAPVDYANVGSTPYAPMDASTLPVYQGSAPSPYMGGYDMASAYGNAQPPAPPVPPAGLYGGSSTASPTYASPAALGSSSSFIDQYLANAGGEFGGSGNIMGLSSQYPAPTMVPPINYAPAQQYVG